MTDQQSEVTEDLDVHMDPSDAELVAEDLECIDDPSGKTCMGPVEYRWPGYGERHFTRCAKHGHQRLVREQEARERYGNPDSPCPPPGFDPMDAGERWEDD
jgi:hypothetical protein